MDYLPSTRPGAPGEGALGPLPAGELLLASRINCECGTGTPGLTLVDALTAAAVAWHGTAWTVQDVDLQVIQAVLETEPQLEGGPGQRSRTGAAAQMARVVL